MQRGPQVCQRDPGVVLGPDRVVHGDLEHRVVSDGGQVVHDAQASVVRLDLPHEPRLGLLDVGGRLSAEHGVGMGYIAHRPHHVVRSRCREAVRRDLLAGAPVDHVGAVLGDEDGLVRDRCQLLGERVVLPPARGRDGDTSGMQGIDEGPELLVDVLVVGEQGAVQIGRDKADVWSRVQRRQLGEVMRIVHPPMLPDQGTSHPDIGRYRALRAR